jgi:hypothetical protein
LRVVGAGAALASDDTLMSRASRSALVFMGRPLVAGAGLSRKAMLYN